MLNKKVVQTSTSSQKEQAFRHSRAIQTVQVKFHHQISKQEPIFLV